MVITNVVASTKSRQAPSNNDLPAGSLRTFTMRFVPILRKYVGALENPWVTESLVRPVQIIWDGVMQGWPHKFTEDNDKVYRLKIYDWRTQFGKAALDAVEAHWASDAKYSNPEVHKNYVESALSPRLPFMYGCVEVLDDLGTIQVRAVRIQGNPLMLLHL
ncbi:hypothetical protein SCLCIDRAFT_966931 [Scleroderma citrinum Foug A]|uniref:Uncharacterized protein n=1 Tax=Scleroderma citrinum Foug A TaxID=1036808 RepID=A0A0C3DHU9_9AGAM|nr:hypothetical protein SCLCIDRAFT_966931 [Scleroderma citrinum Foug A]